MQDGTLEPYHKSTPVPEVSDQPVEKVAASNLNDVIFNSAKKGSLLILHFLFKEILVSHKLLIYARCLFCCFLNSEDKFMNT